MRKLSRLSRALVDALTEVVDRILSKYELRLTARFERKPDEPPKDDK